MLSKLSLPTYTKGNTLGPEQSLADEIWRHFGKQINFALIRKKIKENGLTAIREDFEEVKKSGYPHPKELFMKKILKEHATQFTPQV